RMPVTGILSYAIAYRLQRPYVRTVYLLLSSPMWRYMRALTRIHSRRAVPQSRQTESAGRGVASGSALRSRQPDSPVALVRPLCALLTRSECQDGDSGYASWNEKKPPWLAFCLSDPVQPAFRVRGCPSV